MKPSEKSNTKTEGDCATCPVRHKCQVKGKMDPCCFGFWMPFTCPEDRSKCKVIPECQAVTGATNGAIGIMEEE